MSAPFAFVNCQVPSRKVSPNNEAIASKLEALLTPAIWAQQGYYRQLWMRDRSALLAFILYLRKNFF